MAAEVSKAYSPTEVEAKWYARWRQANGFRADAQSARPPYSIVIPPPNVTGVLHLGHVLNNTIQDVLARRARLEGREVLWLPGTDHAGIATQSVVERDLRREGLTRRDLGRDRFVQRVQEWKEKHGGIIIRQLQRLGCSCDWSRERYTLDPDYTAAVLQVFADLYRQGRIYRGRRMVNWCPKTQTALSDEEVIKKKVRGFLYHMRYEIVEHPGKYLEIATTRPETLMGDTGVAVHPDDPRYRAYVGKHCRRPFPEADIPIVADPLVDPEFGTGVLKVTPAHDRVDFEIGQRHGLPAIDVLHPDGTLNELAGPEFAGLDRETAREKAAAKLEELGLLLRREPYENEVGFSERGDVPIEPRLSLQWFLRYPCAAESAAAVATDRVRFRPERWKKTYAHWMENIQDWCISRQLWWGHRIPVWYPRAHLATIEHGQLSEEELRSLLHVGADPPPDPENWVQDEDVLDTWFSSWLWPFATMDTETRDRFYPTSDLVTGPDILFFWVARMIMAGLAFTGQIPFQNVFFTSLIRDAKGRKLSKSLGNSPDCLELLDRYGADGVRFGLLRIAPTGTDVRYDEERMKEGRNFATKLWNAARYRLLQDAPAAAGIRDPGDLSPYALDILARLGELEQRLAESYASYRFNEIANLLYEFFWSHYCDWYLESVKEDFAASADPARRAATLATMDTVLRRFLVQLHPYMPHLTEEVWEMLGYGQPGSFLMQESLPASPPLAAAAEDVVTAARERAQAVYETVRRARHLKAAYNLAANRSVRFLLRPSVPWMEQEMPTFLLLAGAASLTLDPSFQPAKGIPAALTPVGELFMPLAGLVDAGEERERLQREMEKVEREVEKVARTLGNADFLSRAPEEVIAENRSRMRDWEQKRDQLREMLDILEA